MVPDMLEVLSFKILDPCDVVADFGAPGRRSTHMQECEAALRYDPNDIDSRHMLDIVVQHQREVVGRRM